MKRYISAVEESPEKRSLGLKNFLRSDMTKMSRGLHPDNTR